MRKLLIGLLALPLFLFVVLGSEAATLPSNPHWPKSTDAPPVVPVYYGGEFWTNKDLIAIDHAIRAWNDAGFVTLVPHPEAPPEPCRQNFHIVVICHFAYVGYDPIMATEYRESGGYMYGAAILVSSNFDVDAYAALWGDAYPQQIWLNMAFTHELGHAIGLGHATSYKGSPMDGSSDCPGNQDYQSLIDLYSRVDGWSYGWDGVGIYGSWCTMPPPTNITYVNRG